MAADKASLLLHPIRMRIIQALGTAEHLTAQQLAERLTDVPQASLYRHLNRLTAGGILVVAEERPVRGAVEKLYTLPGGRLYLGTADLANATPDDHMRYFLTFLAQLMGEFGRYLQQPDIDLVRDGVGYREHPLYMTDEELAHVSVALGQVLAPYATPAPGRKLRSFTTILMPHPDQPSQADGEADPTTEGSN